MKEIVSPMVGTFYLAASPDAPAFVEVGKPVTEDTVVCIIEAMKVMNEIKAETSGVIAEVLAENGKPVQFGQALLESDEVSGRRDRRARRIARPTCSRKFSLLIAERSRYG
jgi:acetyl-CoA carboxylase biotin carboxyl carrier protein